MCCDLVVRGHRGVKRLLSATVSDTTQATANVYDPNNARETRTEIARYTLASRAALKPSVFYTMGGPDSAKFGTSLSVSAGILGCSDSKKCVVAHPQVQCFH